MKRGDTKTVNLPDGTSVRAEYLGKGHFCTAYRAGDRVFCFVREDEYMKDVICEMIDGPVPHVPAIEKLGEVRVRGEYRKVYEMRYYPTVAARDESAWGHYKVLREVAEKVHRRYVSGGQRLETDGAYFNRDVIEESRGLVPESLTGALEEIADAACNYGCGVSFEFAPRNLGVDGEGRLVLRDVIFDAEKLAQERAEKARARRYWG